MKIGQKIQMLRKEAYLTQSQLAERAGVSTKTIIRYEQGTENITATIVKKIASALGTTDDCLLSSDHSVAAFVPPPRPQPRQQPRPLSDPYPKSDAAQNYVSIPFLAETYASMGNGAINYEDAPVSMTFSEEFLQGHLGIRKHRDLHIITAIGDSMQPTIVSGELLFVLPLANENGAIMSGGVYVINIKGDVFVKRVARDPLTGALTLKGDNREYPPITIRGDELDVCRVVGRVVGHFDRI
jgi:phage repressor protein C with HTH and peptisase S24 domain